MTPIEGRSLLRGGFLLLILAVLRLGVDSRSHNDPVLVAGDNDLPDLLEESLDAKHENERRSAPLAPGETLDPNRSGEEDLDRLPGIGPATARALITSREEVGGFWRAEDLLDVPGIGPATLDKIRPYLDFSGGVPLDFRDRKRGRTSRLGTGKGWIPQGAAPASSPTGRSAPRIDLNRASAEELVSLPGIGPALAGRIMESRRSNGQFLKPEDLLRVPGIGPATLNRIRNLILPRG